MTSEDLMFHLCAFFAVNPDEMLTTEDVAIKWNLGEKTVLNWKRRFHADNQFISFKDGMFTPGPALKP